MPELRISGRQEEAMDSEINLIRFGFTPGDRVILVDDDWSVAGHDMTVVDAEPVPGSTQCIIRDGDDVRTVSRWALRPA